MSHLHSSAERDVIDRAREAVSSSAWVVGECAAEWTQRWSRGRTDQDFANLVGLTFDQVYPRRRVWETFGDESSGTSRNLYPDLSWSHFERALAWDDRAECLEWAQDNEASVAEMRAWRRMQRGDDLTVDEVEVAQPVMSLGIESAAEVVSEPTINRETRQAPNKEPPGNAQKLRSIIGKIRRAAREAQKVFGSTAGACVLADELAAIESDLRQGEDVSGLDENTLKAALAEI